MKWKIEIECADMRASGGPPLPRTCGMVVYIEADKAPEACSLAMAEAVKLGMVGAYVEKLWALDTIYVNWNKTGIEVLAGT